MCEPPAKIARTRVKIFRPGREPPTPPVRQTVRLINASNPSRTTSVATTTSPALATKFGSSTITSVRSIACDTPLTGSASSVGDHDDFEHRHRPSPGGTFRGYAARLSDYSSVDPG